MRQATGADKETTQKRAQRRSAAIMVSSAGFRISEKILHHKTKDTTEAHYTINPAYQRY